MAISLAVSSQNWRIMVYDSIDKLTENARYPHEQRIAAIQIEIDVLLKGIPVEDSRKREAEMKASIALLKRERSRLHGLISQIQEECFKDRLVEEYGLERTMPIFDKVYALAYEYGHSSGFSSIENHFGDFVELVRN